MRAVNKVKDASDSNIKKLDIRGKVCPMTFVYTKITLEKMIKGEILEVTLDFPAAVENVPDSVKKQNLGEILEVSELNTDKKAWKIVIQKT
jgi:tRNA 2-thiouridine synthesizing protein A